MKVVHRIVYPPGSGFLLHYITNPSIFSTGPKMVLYWCFESEIFFLFAIKERSTEISYPPGAPVSSYITNPQIFSIVFYWCWSLHSISKLLMKEKSTEEYCCSSGRSGFLLHIILLNVKIIIIMPLLRNTEIYLEKESIFGKKFHPRTGSL
jgi:hypothetical protein